MDALGVDVLAADPLAGGAYLAVANTGIVTGLLELTVELPNLTLEMES
jgi:hypothetical protein